MAVYSDGAYLTQQGSTAIGNVLSAAGPLQFTRATVGDGFLPSGTAPEAMTDLAHYVMDVMIASITSPQEGQSEVVLQINSADVAAAFAASEIMLWADDPVNG